MKTATVAIRLHSVPERIEAVCRGLERIGYQPVRDWRHKGDIAVTWNMHGVAQDIKRRMPGAPILCMENGYLSPDIFGNVHYALALGGHNGNGRTPEPRTDGEAAERFRALFEAPKPWRQSGKHVLVAASRGIGDPGVSEPLGWKNTVMHELGGVADRPVIRRLHPQTREGRRQPSLADQLRGAWCVVVWASNVATTALHAGIPVCYRGPSIAARRAAFTELAAVVDPPTPGTRDLAFGDIAMSQWTLDEIATGEPFVRLLELA